MYTVLINTFYSISLFFQYLPTACSKYEYEKKTFCITSIVYLKLKSNHFIVSYVCTYLIAIYHDVIKHRLRQKIRGFEKNRKKYLRRVISINEQVGSQLLSDDNTAAFIIDMVLRANEVNALSTDVNIVVIIFYRVGMSQRNINSTVIKHPFKLHNLYFMERADIPM